MTNIKYMNKAELLALAEEGGIDIPEGATNPQIRKLLTAPPKKAPKPIPEPEPIVESGPSEVDILREQLKELEATWSLEPDSRRRSQAKQNMQKIKDKIALLN